MDWKSEDIIPHQCDPCVGQTAMDEAIAQFVSITGAPSDVARYVTY